MKNKNTQMRTTESQRVHLVTTPVRKTSTCSLFRRVSALIGLLPIGIASSALQAQNNPCANLIVNGGFESPVVTLPRGYHFFATIPGWTADPFIPGEILGTSKTIEIQRGVAGSPFEGAQLVELDSWSPSSMYQDISTVPGQRYLLRFAYSPRPRVTDNGIEVKWGSSVIAIVNRDGAGNPGTVWSVEQFIVVATDTTTRLRFTDVSGNDALGGYLDAVSLTINTPPIARCRNVTAVSGPNCQADASVDSGSSDPDAGDTVTLSQTPGGPYPLGSTEVILTVSDRCGETDTCAATVTVLSSASISWLPPLAGQPVANKIRVGQVVPHKVQVADCNGFLPGGVTVRLKVEGLNSSDAAVEQVVEDANGTGVDGTVANDGIMVLRDGHYHFNLNTDNLYSAAAVSAGVVAYRSTVIVTDDLSGLIIGTGSIILRKK